jgi:hypothetical protein
MSIALKLTHEEGIRLRQQSAHKVERTDALVDGKPTAGGIVRYGTDWRFDKYQEDNGKTSDEVRQDRDQRLCAADLIDRSGRREHSDHAGVLRVDVREEEQRAGKLPRGAHREVRKRPDGDVDDRQRGARVCDPAKPHRRIAVPIHRTCRCC